MADLLQSKEFILAREYVDLVEELKLKNKRIGRKHMMKIHHNVYKNEKFHSYICTDFLIKNTLLFIKDPENYDRTCLFEDLTKGLRKCGCYT